MSDFSIFLLQTLAHIKILLVFNPDVNSVLLAFSGDRYCPMLEEEGGADILRQLISNPESNKHVVQISKDILALGRENRAQAQKKRENSR